MIVSSPCAAVVGVGASAIDERVVVGVAPQHVGRGAAGKRVVAGVAIEQQRRGGDRLAAVEQVGAGAAEDLDVAETADGVGHGEDADDVGPVVAQHAQLRKARRPGGFVEHDRVIAVFGVDRDRLLVGEVNRLEGVDRDAGPGRVEQVAIVVGDLVGGVQQAADQGAVDVQRGGGHVVDDRFEFFKVDGLHIARTRPTTVLTPEPMVAPTVIVSLVWTVPPVWRTSSVSMPRS